MAKVDCDLFLDEQRFSPSQKYATDVHYGKFNQYQTFDKYIWKVDQAGLKMNLQTYWIGLSFFRSSSIFGWRVHKMFTKCEKGAGIDYITIHLILLHPALLTLQKLKTQKYLKLMKKSLKFKVFHSSLICSIIKQLLNMREGVVMLLEVKNACYSAKLANMLKNGFFSPP